jgi:hypothetical protein
MRELQVEQERRRQELRQLEPSAVVAHRHPVYAAVGPAQPQPELQPSLLGATWPSMPTSTLEDEAERWLMQAEQDATAYAARGPPLPTHHHHHQHQQQPQIYAQQQLRPSMIAAADPVMGLSMPLDIGADGRTQQQPPSQMAPVASRTNSFMSTSPAAAVSYTLRRPPHPPHPPPPSGPTHNTNNTTSSRDNQ